MQDYEHDMLTPDDLALYDWLIETGRFYCLNGTGRFNGFGELTVSTMTVGCEPISRETFIKEQQFWGS